MSSGDRSELADILQAKQDSIAECWHRAIAQTSYVSLDAVRVRELLATWTGEILNLLTAETFELGQAVAIGQALARLHYLQPEALARTQDILSRLLVAGVPPELALALYPRLTSLLAELAYGFYREARTIILSEQEEVRSALVNELAKTATALQESRNHLELRVQQRTRELESLNQELQNEILERERIAQALRNSEARYRTVTDLISDYVYSIEMTPSGTPVLEWATEAYSGITGYSAQNFETAEDWKRLIHPDDLAIATQHFRRHLAGIPGVSDYRIVTQSGQVRWVRDHSQPVWDELEGRVVRVYGAVQDVTERKGAEEALRKSENEYRRLLESIHDGVYTLDTEGRFTFVNAVISERSGRSREWFQGRKLTETLRPEDRERAWENLMAVLRGETVPVYELGYVEASGNVKWAEVNTTAIWEGGQIVGLHGVSRDITERKKIEELKDNLIRDVSHELRTPLAKLRMGLDLLNEMLAEEEIDRVRASRIGGVVRGNVQRLLRTVEVMLDLSSLESGQIAYAMEKVDPGKLVEDVVADMYPLVALKGLDLVPDLPASLPLIVGDREKLFRVMVNLVDNAAKFTEEGTITISARGSSSQVVLAVRDPGIGILPEHLERIFERFFQEKNRFHGVGVGLAICKAIVEAHGGRIWAESPGRGLGSTIQFALPITTIV